MSATDLCNPGGLAFDTQENLYVADTGNNRVVVYNQPLGGSSSAPTPTAANPNGNRYPDADGHAYPHPTLTATPSATPTADAILQVQPKAIRFPDQAVGKQRPLQSNKAASPAQPQKRPSGERLHHDRLNYLNRPRVPTKLAMQRSSVDSG